MLIIYCIYLHISLPLSQHSLRIRIPLELHYPKIKTKRIVFIPKMIHNFSRYFYTVSSISTHRRIVYFNFCFCGMMHGDFLLISLRFFFWSEVLSHYPHRTTLVVPLDAPEDFVFDLRSPKGVRERFSYAVNLLGPSRDMGIVEKVDIQHLHA